MSASFIQAADLGTQMNRYVARESQQSNARPLTTSPLARGARGFIRRALEWVEYANLR